jgi:hypothetical protein
LRVVGQLAPRLERPLSGSGEIDLRLGETAAPEDVERPDHAGGTNVQVLQRRRRLPAVPFVRRPELLWFERGIRVDNDASDRVAHAALAPRFVGQRLV